MRASSLLALPILIGLADRADGSPAEDAARGIAAGAVVTTGFVEVSVYDFEAAEVSTTANVYISSGGMMRRGTPVDGVVRFEVPVGIALVQGTASMTRSRAPASIDSNTVDVKPGRTSKVYLTVHSVAVRDRKRRDQRQEGDHVLPCTVSNPPCRPSF